MIGIAALPGKRPLLDACNIPHCAGPPYTLLRHSFPAHPSQPLIFANLIRVSLTVRILCGYGSVYSDRNRFAQHAMH